MSSIYDLPDDERRIEAVRRFKIITGENIFERLLDYLELSQKEFTKEYGDKLASNPNYCNPLIVDMCYGNIMKRGYRRG